MERYLNSFKALADGTRLRILGILFSGAFNVNELVGILDMGQSRVSRHLRILAGSGLVEARREGSWIYYRLSPSWGSGGSEGGRGGDRGDLRYLRLLRHELRTRLDVDRAGIEACLRRRREGAHRFFKEVAGSWDRRRAGVEGPREHVDALMEALGHTGTVVDLGTGTGVLLPRLGAAAERVIGVDGSPEMLEVAGRNASEKGWRNVDLRLGTLEHLPVPDGEADAMVANMVLHHVASPPEALREVRRGLRPGGTLVIADFGPHAEESYREKLGDLWLGFERGDLEGWLRDAKFDIESYREIASRRSRPRVILLVARRQ